MIKIETPVSPLISPYSPLFGRVKLVYSLISDMTNILRDIIKKSIMEIEEKKKGLNDGINYLNRARAKRPTSGSANFPVEALKWIDQYGQGQTDFSGKLSVERYDQAILTMKGLIDDLKSRMDLDMVFLRQTISDQNQTIEYLNSLSEKTNRTNLSIMSMFRQ